MRSFDDDEDDLSDEEYSSSEASDGVDMDMDLDGPACSNAVNVVGMDVDGEETGPAGAERARAMSRRKSEGMTRKHHEVQNRKRRSRSLRCNAR